MSIKIVTDSTADLSPELISRYNIEVIPLSVYFGEQVYRDGVDLTPDQFLEKINTSQEFPKTAQVTPAEFLKIFRRLLDEGHEIFYTGISSKLSGTYTSACLAAEELKGAPIAITDSLNLSTGIGIQVLYAAELAAEGVPLAEIAQRVSAMARRVRCSFIVNTMDFLLKGGRVTKAQAIIGNVLQIHPRIEVVDGKMIVPEKFRGSKAKANARLIEWAVNAKERIDKHRLFVTHGYDHDSANYIAEQLREMKVAREILVTQAGAVISSHCGPGTVGIIYAEKE